MKPRTIKIGTTMGHQAKDGAMTTVNPDIDKIWVDNKNNNCKTSMLRHMIIMVHTTITNVRSFQTTHLCAHLTGRTILDWDTNYLQDILRVWNIPLDHCTIVKICITVIWVHIFHRKTGIHKDNRNTGQCKMYHP